jgi:uncharacterized radical SAM superfamily protein
MKALLLNLPFTRKVMRDVGCPHTIKSDYYLPQADLLCFGAILRGEAELEYLDCIMENLTPDQALARVKAISPDHIFTIISSITLKEDVLLLKAIKKSIPDVKVWASGDITLFSHSRPAVVDFHVCDFTNKKGVLDLLHSKAEKGVVARDPSPVFSMGISPHELVKRYSYFFPHSRYVPTTGVFSNYGCPFKCKFCSAGTLNNKRRDRKEVIEELKYIKELGIKDVFFRDFTFAVPDAAALCDAMLEEKLGLSWSCETRVDVVNEALLRKMKAAGCYLIFYGVESGNDDTLKRINKGFATSRVREMVRKTKDAGIEVLTSFILGLPGDDIERTIDFMFELDPDYLSINLLVPRLGSAIRQEDEVPEGANTDCLYSTSELMKKRNDTEKRFYLRPFKLARYLAMSIRSSSRIGIFMRNGVGLLKKWGNSDSIPSSDQAQK